MSLSNQSDFLEVSTRIYSNRLNLEYSIDSKIKISELKSKKVIQGKVFNLYLDKNLVLVYFEGAKALSYALIELSISKILLGFMKISEKFKKKLLRDAPAHLKSQLKQKMSVAPSVEYYNIQEFLREMTDFEVIASLHNGKERIFYFINTMAIPQYRKSEKLNCEALIFEFDDLREPLNSSNFTLHFSNAMGIKETIENLVFCEVIVKDH